MRKDKNISPKKLNVSLLKKSEDQNTKHISEGSLKNNSISISEDKLQDKLEDNAKNDSIEVIDTPVIQLQETALDSIPVFLNKPNENINPMTKNTSKNPSQDTTQNISQNPIPNTIINDIKHESNASNIKHTEKKNNPVIISLAILLALAAAGYSMYENVQLKKALKQVDLTNVANYSKFKKLSGQLVEIEKLQKNAQSNNKINIATQNALTQLEHTLKNDLSQIGKKNLDNITQMLGKNNESQKMIADISQNIATTNANTRAIMDEFSVLREQFSNISDTVNVAQKNAISAIESVHALETKLIEKSMQQESAYQDISELTAKLKASTDIHALNLAEVHYLLRIAEHTLSFEKNVPNTKVALITAQKRLVEVNEPEYAETLLQINATLDDLNKITLPDRNQIANTLSLISKDMLTAPLLSDKSIENLRKDFLQSQKYQGDADKSILNRLLDNITPLFRVQRTRIEAPALMQTENIFFLNQNLQLQLAAAQNALQTRMNDVYLENIKMAKELINTYYDSSNVAVATAKAKLEQLLLVNYNDNTVSILPKLKSILTTFEVSSTLRGGNQ